MDITPAPLRDLVVRSVLGRHVDIIDIVSDDAATAVVVASSDRARTRAALAAFEYRFVEVDDRPETIRYTVSADQFAA